MIKWPAVIYVIWSTSCLAVPPGQTRRPMTPSDVPISAPVSSISSLSTLSTISSLSEPVKWEAGNTRDTIMRSDSMAKDASPDKAPSNVSGRRMSKQWQDPDQAVSMGPGLLQRNTSNSLNSERASNYTKIPGEKPVRPSPPQKPQRQPSGCPKPGLAGLVESWNDQVYRNQKGRNDFEAPDRLKQTQEAKPTLKPVKTVDSGSDNGSVPLRPDPSPQTPALGSHRSGETSNRQMNGPNSFRSSTPPSAYLQAGESSLTTLGDISRLQIGPPKVKPRAVEERRPDIVFLTMKDDMREQLLNFFRFLRVLRNVFEYPDENGLHGNADWEERYKDPDVDRTMYGADNGVRQLLMDNHELNVSIGDESTFRVVQTPQTRKRVNSFKFVDENSPDFRDQPRFCLRLTRSDGATRQPLSSARSAELCRLANIRNLMADLRYGLESVYNPRRLRHECTTVFVFAQFAETVMVDWSSYESVTHGATNVELRRPPTFQRGVTVEDDYLIDQIQKEFADVIPPLEEAFGRYCKDTTEFRGGRDYMRQLLDQNAFISAKLRDIIHASACVSLGKRKTDQFVQQLRVLSVSNMRRPPAPPAQATVNESRINEGGHEPRRPTPKKRRHGSETLQAQQAPQATPAGLGILAGNPPKANTYQKPTLPARSNNSPTIRLAESARPVGPTGQRADVQPSAGTLRQPSAPHPVKMSPPQSSRSSKNQSSQPLRRQPSQPSEQSPPQPLKPVPSQQFEQSKPSQPSEPSRPPHPQQPRSQDNLGNLAQKTPHQPNSQSPQSQQADLGRAGSQKPSAVASPPKRPPPPLFPAAERRRTIAKRRGSDVKPPQLRWPSRDDEPTPMHGVQFVGADGAVISVATPSHTFGPSAADGPVAVRPSKRRHER